MNSKTIKNYIKEILNKRKLYFPGKLKTFKQYGLIETQVYQDGINFNKVLKKSISKSLSKLKLKKKYKIASMGTCFAEEVSRFLKNKDDLGTYLQLEENIWDFPVNWG